MEFLIPYLEIKFKRNQIEGIQVNARVFTNLTPNLIQLEIEILIQNIQLENMKFIV